MTNLTSELIFTIAALAICLTLGVFSYHRHTRPHDKLSPRLVPWIIIAIACLATSFMLLVHLVNMFGIETGGRSRF